MFILHGELMKATSHEGKTLRFSKMVSEIPSHITRGWVLGIIAFAAYVSELPVKNSLSNYDTGVYVTAAFHLSHGLLPYRDFTFVQPPGILYFLLAACPYGFMGSSATALLFSKVTMCAVSSVNVVLLFRLVRPQGRWIASLAAIAFAFLPTMIFETDSVKIEPLVTFFLLLALNQFKNLTNLREISDRQLVHCGILIGLATSVKYWAAIPAAVLFTVLLFRLQKRVWRFVAAALLAFFALCSPFLLNDGADFIRETITAQLSRNALSGWQVPIWTRMIYVLGSSTPSLEPSIGLVVLLAFEIAAAVFAGYLLKRKRSILELLTLWITAAALIFVLLLPEWFPYYATFCAPFLIATASFAIGGVAEGISRLSSAQKIYQRIDRPWRLFGVVALLVLGTVMHRTWADAYQSGSASFNAPVETIAKKIPAQDCVVFDVAYYALESNRLSEFPKCPIIVDAGGMELVQNSRHSLSLTNSTSAWIGIFQQAKFVVLETANSPFIPWSDNLSKYFNSHFTLVNPGEPLLVFQRKN